MKTYSFSFFSAILLGALPALFFSGSVTALVCPVKEGAVIVGEAKSVDTEKLLYCEYHFNLNAEQSKKNRDADKRVKYYNESDALIAHKTIDYSSGLLSPTVVQEDLRHGETRMVKQKDESSFSMYYHKPNTKSESQPVIIKASPNLIVDAGFDDAIRQSWEQLVQGQSIVFAFASPVHARTIGLRVKKTDKANCGSAGDLKESQVCYRIGAANAVLSMFVKPLALIYDKNSKRLMRFAGQVNITTAKGKTQTAIIDYQYN